MANLSEHDGAADRTAGAVKNESFLRPMIRHHSGALPMADDAAEQAGRGKLAVLTQSMSDGQASEIEAMQNLLTGRALAAEPEGTAAHGSSHALRSAGWDGDLSPGPVSACFWEVELPTLRGAALAGLPGADVLSASSP